MALCQGGFGDLEKESGVFQNPSTKAHASTGIEAPGLRRKGQACVCSEQPVLFIDGYRTFSRHLLEFNILLSGGRVGETRVPSL